MADSNVPSSVNTGVSILEYLEEKYPQPDMIGSTPEARAMTRDLMYMVNDYFLFLSYYFSQRSPLFATTFEQKPDAATAFYAAYQRSIREIEQTNFCAVNAIQSPTA